MSVDAHRSVGRGATIGAMPLVSNDVRGNKDASKFLLARQLGVGSTRKKANAAHDPLQKELRPERQHGIEQAERFCCDSDQMNFMPMSILHALVRRKVEGDHTGPTEETAMSYIDGFVIAVPNANRERFIAHANTFDAIFMEFGATRVLECWGDNVSEGKLTDFRRAVQAEKDESVVFSWIEWPDKATHDAGMEKFMKDPRMAAASDMPFDGKRMIFGGFVPVVSLSA